MRLTNVTGLPVSWTMGFQRDGREMLIVMAKATYSIPPTGQAAQLATEHVEIAGDQDVDFRLGPRLSGLTTIREQSTGLMSSVRAR